MGRVVLILLLIAAIFHRPILHELIRFAAVKIAASERIRLSLRVGGSVFTNLTLENIRATPTGPSPVEDIRVDSARCEYTLSRLIRRGPREFLKNCEVKNADVVINPMADIRRPHRERADQPHDVASAIGDIFFPPSLIADRVSIENASVRVRTPDGDVGVRGADLLLDPKRTGWLRIAELQIPDRGTWAHISATTSYAGRDLVLRGITLDQDVAIHTLELDASRRSENLLRVSVRGTFFGSATSATMELKPQGKAATATIQASTAELSLDHVSRYICANPPFSGTLQEALLTLSGNPDIPASWNGTLRVLGEEIRIGDTNLGRVAATLVARDGEARLSGAEVSVGVNKLVAQGNCRLPQRIGDFPATEVNAKFRITAPKLNEIVPELVAGALTAEGRAAIRDKTLTGDVTFSGRDLLGEKFALGAIDARIALARLLAPQDAAATFFDGMQSHVSGSFKELRVGDYAADSGTVSFDTRDRRVHVGQVEFARAGNTVSAHGEYDLPLDSAPDTIPRFDVDFAISAPSLNGFNAEPNLTGLNGRLEAKGKISHHESFEGQITATGSNLVIQELTAEKLGIDVVIERSIASLKRVDLAINATDHVIALGKVALHAPFAYDGSLSVKVKDIGIFQPLLRAAGKREALAGAVAIEWTGSGTVNPPAHAGQTAVAIRKVRYGAIEITDAKLDGTYIPTEVNFPGVHIVSNEGSLDCAIEILEGKLRVRDIKFQRGGEALTGFVILPIDLDQLSAPKKLIPFDERIAAVVNATNLDLEKVYATIGKKSPATGSVSMALTAGGTLYEPTGNLKFTAKNLKPKALPKLEPTDIDLAMHYSRKELTLNAVARQRQLQPLEVRGRMPLDIQQTIAAARFDPKTPVDLTVRLPKSSAGIVGQLLPIVRYVEGQAGIDARVGGTIEKPALSGSISVDLTALRFRDVALPPVNGLKADLKFTEDHLVFSRFDGQISGGPFVIGGQVHFEKLTEPVFDLELKSQNLLLVRDETLTVRADADLKVSGPFNAASVTGKIAITKSRFFREVDILPIELPGRPAPKPPEAETGFSLAPPLRDWKFDVAIKTKEPFVIRGNLTNGSVATDLKLLGTGGAPTLDGTATIERLVASLPFSKLDVTNGYVHFSRDEPFVPKLDIQGVSNMRDYKINVYIFGTASNPQTIFSSEPPLPQDDIVSLLATGATSKELVSNRDALAGRAAVLVLQKLYRTVFKKKADADTNESAFNRFALDVGGIDPRTGRQEVSTRFKIGQDFYLVGDLDVQGGIRGQVKYLIRFR